MKCKCKQRYFIKPGARGVFKNVNFHTRITIDNPGYVDPSLGVEALALNREWYANHYSGKMSWPRGPCCPGYFLSSFIFEVDSDVHNQGMIYVHTGTEWIEGFGLVRTAFMEGAVYYVPSSSSQPYSVRIFTTFHEVVSLVSAPSIDTLTLGGSTVNEKTPTLTTIMAFYLGNSISGPVFRKYKIIDQRQLYPCFFPDIGSYTFEADNTGLTKPFFFDSDVWNRWLSPFNVTVEQSFFFPDWRPVLSTDYSINHFPMYNCIGAGEEEETWWGFEIELFEGI
jgi:hypothetical protein